jgi:putative ABC transport system permease protein
VIRHLLKLVWNRKRANLLVIAEIFVSFLVIFAVLAAVLAIAPSWSKPLGFEYRNVWDVGMAFDIDASEKTNPELRDSVRRMVVEAASFPEVEAVAVGNTPPYNFSSAEGSWRINGKDVRLMFDDVTDDYLDVMKLEVVRGRWFTAEDDAAGYRPVVLDENAARALYGDGNPIGQKFDKEAREPNRIVGVVKTYRKDGEMSLDHNMIFRRVSLTSDMGRLGSHVLIRVAPGAPPELEEKLAERLHAVAPAVGFRVRRMEAMRTTALRLRAAPVVVGAVIALFLISMVTLGLTGVLWQNVTRRTREIGLRRAMGATGTTVRGQVLGEVALLATIALLLGTIVLLQLPLLGIFALVPPAMYTLALVAALAAMYALTLLCGLYPSWLASRLQPADALRYE